jgi:hypothetical protein
MTKVSADPASVTLPRVDPTSRAPNHYVPFDPSVATVDALTGLVQTGSGSHPRVYAIAILSVGELPPPVAAITPPAPPPPAPRSPPAQPTRFGSRSASPGSGMSRLDQERPGTRVHEPYEARATVSLGAGARVRHWPDHRGDHARAGGLDRQADATAPRAAAARTRVERHASMVTVRLQAGLDAGVAALNKHNFVALAGHFK